MNESHETVAAAPWPVWERILFRFFFVYLMLEIAPWDWFGSIPGVRYALVPYRMLIDWAVRASNDHIFHVRPALVLMNGSGDTSYAWTELWLFCSVALAACIVWSAFDRKREEHGRLLYWLRLTVRYFIASAALGYGIIKLYRLQMPFPTESQLATPLGDLLPMRFSWFFIGYSQPYQFFSGLMETTAGVLLLFPRTVTAGLFAATGAFMNVVMINVSYDVPVKLYSMHLLFACLFLLALDSKRLVNFLVLNRATPPTTAYTPSFAAPWQRWGSIAVKLFLAYEFLVAPLMSSSTRYQLAKRPPQRGPFSVGMYDVRSFAVNRAVIPPLSGDTLRWKDLIIDSNGAGSVNTSDDLFQQRYHRGYFRYKADSVTHTAAVWKTSAKGDSTFLFTMRYEIPDSNTIRLHTVIRGDSVHVELARIERHFQLTERQFHWLSEYNR